ncbi:MAG: hypothetical protein HY835_05540 [Anaerolineae bacterium]|nr:hypothetical protein [Anaerolineae bacterium]
MKPKNLDERSVQLNGQVSFWVLMLTQIALAGWIVINRYVLGKPMQETGAIAAILGFSMAAYWGLRAYLSGALPVISWRRMLVIYILVVAVIFFATLLIQGVPPVERRYEMAYPFAGVAVVLGVYMLVAYLGKRRMDTLISE